MKSLDDRKLSDRIEHRGDAAADDRNRRKRLRGTAQCGRRADRRDLEKIAAAALFQTSGDNLIDRPSRRLVFDKVTIELLQTPSSGVRDMALRVEREGIEWRRILSHDVRVTERRVT